MQTERAVTNSTFALDIKENMDLLMQSNRFPLSSFYHFHVSIPTYTTHGILSHSVRYVDQQHRDFFGALSQCVEVEHVRYFYEQRETRLQQL